MMPFDLAGQTPHQTPFVRIGGREVVRRVVDAFYRRVGQDEVLRPLFPEDLSKGIEKQKRFMEQWLGGEPLFSLQHGQPMLRRRHFPFVIGPKEAERWLAHMRAALEECEVDGAVILEVMQRLEPLAYHMVNEDQDVPRGPLPDLGPVARQQRTPPQA